MERDTPTWSCPSTSTRSKHREEKIGEILTRILQRHRRVDPAEIDRIRDKIVNVIGPERMADIRVKGMHRGTLILGIRSAPLRHEIEAYYGSTILASLRDGNGSFRVVRVRYQVEG